MKRKLIIFCVFYLIAVSGLAQREWESKLEPDISLEKIGAINRLYGYARYFYPNKEAQKLDWHKFLVMSLSQVAHLNTDEEFENKLSELFSPIIPELRISRTQLTLK